MVFCSKNRRPILPCLPPAALNLCALCIDFVKKLLQNTTVDRYNNKKAGTRQDRSEIFRRIKQQYFREQLAPLGFQPMDGMILYLLWGGNCLRQEDIAAQTALDKGAVARSVARLEERGLVERWVSDQCRREKQVSLTPAGEERAGAVQKILESWNDICCRGFSSEERTLYNSFLSRIIENVMQYKRGEEGDDG